MSDPTPTYLHKFIAPVKSTPSPAHGRGDGERAVKPNITINLALEEVPGTREYEIRARALREAADMVLAQKEKLYNTMSGLVIKILHEQILGLIDKKVDNVKI